MLWRSAARHHFRRTTTTSLRLTATWQQRASDYGIVRIRVVPLLVPLLRYSSGAESFLFTTNKSVPLTLINSLGQGWQAKS